MSQALFERVAQSRHQARSAGTQPADRLHPGVVAVMREVGLELNGREPQQLTTESAQWADVVVTMGCGDACPVIPGKRYLEWDLPDPAGRPLDEVRRTRETISGLVEGLVSELDRRGTGSP